MKALKLKSSTDEEPVFGEIIERPHLGVSLIERSRSPTIFKAEASALTWLDAYDLTQSK